jgi:hypothetical protein
MFKVLIIYRTTCLHIPWRYKLTLITVRTPNITQLLLVLSAVLHTQDRRHPHGQHAGRPNAKVGNAHTKHSIKSLFSVPFFPRNYTEVSWNVESTTLETSPLTPLLLLRLAQSCQIVGLQPRLSLGYHLVVTTYARVNRMARWFAEIQENWPRAPHIRGCHNTD